MPMPKEQYLLDNIYYSVRLHPLYSVNRGIWLGLTRREDGQFEWDDGEVMDEKIYYDHVMWKDREAPGDCVSVWHHATAADFQLQVTHCWQVENINYICEEGNY